jgi:hypothetical protein
MRPRPPTGLFGLSWDREGAISGPRDNGPRRASNTAHTALQNYRKAKALVVRVPQHGLAEARTGRFPGRAGLVR